MINVMDIAPGVARRPAHRPDAARTAPFLDAADRIGRRLCRDAVWSGPRCNWLGWSMEPIGGAYRPAYRVLPPSLYAGAPGIALFLAHLHRFTGDRHQRAALRGAAAQVLGRLDALAAAPFGGLHAGLLGVGHTLVTLGELEAHEPWIQAGVDAMERSLSQEIGPLSLDYLVGAAGAIPALLDVGRRHGRPALEEGAQRCGEILLRHAETTDEGVSWPSPQMPGKNLTGFSHGTAGMACGLLELHHVAPDPRLLAAAQGALAYERRHFDAARGNWPDFRPIPGVSGPTHPVAWCHGAGGIGVSRVRIRELLPDDALVLPEIDAAVQRVAATLSEPITPGASDFSLCHGIFGNADLLLLVADQFQRADARRGAEHLGHVGIELHERAGLPWGCGVLGAGETPGLMLGTAGIGHFYLRLHDSRSVPSALLLRPQDKA